MSFATGTVMFLYRSRRVTARACKQPVILARTYRACMHIIRARMTSAEWANMHMSKREALPDSCSPCPLGPLCSCWVSI